MRMRGAVVCATVITGAIHWAPVTGLTPAPLKGLTTPQQTSPQTFRTGTDVVMVDVSVREGGRAVTGLGAQDFVLTDNGVRQRIDSVEAAAVPLDVTLVVDVSGNPRAGWVKRESNAKAAERVRHEISGVAGLLRQEDRLRAFAIDSNLQQVVSARQATAGVPPVVVEAGGLSSLYDTLAAALLQPVQPARRHVVIARTKGIDTMSTVDAAGVRGIAERSDALFHLVTMQTEWDNDSALLSFQCAMMGFCWPSRSFWIPHERRLMSRIGQPPYIYRLTPDGETLAAAAEATGGALHRAELLSEPTLAGTFKKAFEDFRSSYVLRYTLQGVPQGGWHSIAVSVPGKRNYTVRSRRGYLVETAAAPAAELPLPAQLRSVPDFTTAYERGAYRQVAGSLRQMADPANLLRDFQEAGNPWPGNPRREAALVLEMVEPGLFATRRETRQAALEAVDRFTKLIRHPLEPDVFERYWHFALLATLEGSLRPGLSELYVERALERFPDEPRFLLSRAIVTDQRVMPRGSGPIPGAALPAPEQITLVRRHYEAAIAFPSIAQEARIRFGFILHRLGRQEDAMSHLNAAATPPLQEPALRYLHQLFAGHVFQAMDKPDEAVAAYKNAMAIAPTAQSARVSLMNLLMLRGETAAAEALSHQVQTEASADMDPWWMYWQGQYRLQPAAMARVRELSR